MRAFLHAADRLRAAGPGIEGARRSGRALRQAQRSVGRVEALVNWEAYQRFAPAWRDEVANVRLHATTKERPIDRFQKNDPVCVVCRSSPSTPTRFSPVIVTPHARIRYDGNRYSVPPELVRKPVVLRASATEVRIE